MTEIEKCKAQIETMEKFLRNEIMTDEQRDGFVNQFNALKDTLVKLEKEATTKLLKDIKFKIEEVKSGDKVPVKIRIHSKFYNQLLEQTKKKSISNLMGCDIIVDNSISYFKLVTI